LVVLAVTVVVVLGDDTGLVEAGTVAGEDVLRGAVSEGANSSYAPIAVPPTVPREAGLALLETTDWARWLPLRVEVRPGSEAVVVGSFGAGVGSGTPPADGSGGVALAALLRRR
jgi:hypothetical protein